MKWVLHLDGISIQALMVILITIDQFGASAKGEKVQEEYGFNVENVVNKMKALFNK